MKATLSVLVVLAGLLSSRALGEPDSRSASTQYVLPPMGRPPLNALLLADELELSVAEDTLNARWDVLSWVGGNYHRFWLLSEGDLATRHGAGRGEAEASAFYGFLYAPFWEVRIGARGALQHHDQSLRGRGFFAIGLEGLAPYLFEVEPTLYVSQHGDVSARLHMSYGLRITQRLVFTPSTEINVAVQSVPKFYVGKGVNDLQLGARLRYELMREVAPYVGVEWRRRFSQTAELVSRAGSPVQDVVALAGARLWF